MKKDYKEYYKNIAPLFDNVRLDKNLEIENTVNIIKKFLNKKSGYILDVGCGTGRYAKYFQKINYDTVGIDLSIDQLKFAPKDFKCVCAASNEIPLKNQYFDAALLSLVLQQLDNKMRLETFKKIHEKLADNGKIFIRTCSSKDLRNRPFNDIFPSSYTINIKRYPEIRIIKNELISIGLVIVDEIATYTEQVVRSKDLLYSMKKKHNTTLSLLPSKEFISGYNALKEKIKGSDNYTIAHHHTIVVASK